jgi:predicted permease
VNPFVTALIIILLGMGVRRANLLGEGAGQTLSRIILNITLPGVVLTSVSKATLPAAAFALPVAAFIWCGAMLFLGSKLFASIPKATGGVLILAMGGYNIGQFAYPLVEATWGSEALALLVMVDIGNALVIFTLSYILAGIWAGQPVSYSSILRRLLTFVPLLSYLLALTINLTGLRLPELVSAPLEILGSANWGLVMLLVGLYLRPQVVWVHLKQVLAVLGLRFLLGVGAGLAQFFLLPLPLLVRSVLLVTVLLPVPMSTIPYSLEYKMDPDLAGALVNGSIIISFALLWLTFTLL